MGLFSFVTNAGAKVLGLGKTLEETQADAIALGVAAELRAEAAAAKEIKEIITDLQLQVVDLSVFIDDDMAVVSGLAYDQATKEKVVLVIGNTKGISMVDDYMTVEHVNTVAKFHTVVNGDTLGKIAKNYYRNALKYPVIFEANKPMLDNPDRIYPGQVLRIPALD